MRTFVRYLLVGVLAVGFTTGCNEKTGSGGGTNPGTGTSQNGGGGY